MKTALLFCLVVILAVCVRFFYLEKSPPGFYSDEAAYAYNAYSILTTGKDEYGASFPIGFQSFGDYKAPLYIYFLVPFVALFGMGEGIIRSASALLGVVSVVQLYVVVLALNMRRRVALLSAYMLAILPFALQFQRMAHENTLVVVLVLSGLWCFLRARTQPWLYLLSAFFFGMSPYAYHDARVFVPLFLCFLVLSVRSYWSTNWRVLSGAAVLFFLLLTPLLLSVGSTVFWARPSRTIFFADPGIALSVNEAVGQDAASAYWEPRFFHNKLVAWSIQYMVNYTAHFSPEFLLWHGDPVKIYQTPHNGLLLLVMAPFLLLGIHTLFRDRLQYRWLMSAWFLLAPIPAAMTRFVPSASRMLTLAPALAVVIALGVGVSSKYVRSYAGRLIIAGILAVAFALNTAYYLHYYYLHLPVQYAKEWHYGLKDVMTQVQERQSAYDTVWFSKKAWGYIYPLYYLRYSPQRYQPQAHLSEPNEYGFGWVAGFDKYVFADLLPDWRSHPQTLYIAAPDEFPADVNPLFVVRYPDGSDAFYGVATEKGQR